MGAIKKMLDEIEKMTVTLNRDTVIEIIRRHLGDLPLVDARIDTEKPLSNSNCHHGYYWDGPHCNYDLPENEILCGRECRGKGVPDCPIKTLKEEGK